MENKIDLFGGTGFIGSRFKSLNQDVVHVHDRENNEPKYKEILYMISTTDNYNVFDKPEKDIETNLLKLIQVLKNCKDKDITFNLISSWFVYGKNNLTINSEDDYCNPKGFYSISKYAQEQFLKSYCETFSINYRILRLCNVIGKDSRASAKKNATEYLIEKLKKNENVNVYEGDNYRNFLFVEDVCKAIKIVIEKGEKNQIYNIGNLESKKMIDVINYCKKILNSKSNINIIPTPIFHKQVQSKDFHMNVKKIYNLGFKPEFSLEKTLDILCK